MLSVLSDDVGVAFSFEASMLWGRWYVKWTVSDQRVWVNCKSGMALGIYLVKVNFLSR